MKLVGMIGRGGGRIAPAALSDVEALMRVSGGNLGNFAFWVGARSILGAEARNLAPRLPLPPDLGALVIPAANWLNPVSDFGWLADVVEAADVPTLLLGLGAQSDSDAHYPSIPEGTLRLLDAVARRSPFLGVRGEYTARLCRHLGFPAVRVLGCPSLFLNPNPRMGEAIERRWHEPCSRIAAHSFSVRARAQTAERFLFRLVRGSPAATFVPQAPREILALCIDPKAPLSAEARQLAERIAPDLDAQSFADIVRRHAFVPESVEHWLGHLRSCTHTLNTRIHGSLMSLAAERPAVCFSHDTRTEELAATLRVPALDAAAVEGTSAEAVLRSIGFDGAAFDANRARLAREYLELFRQTGVPAADRLNALAGA